MQTHLGAEAVHFHPLPGLCMGHRKALVPSPGLPSTLEWAFGPKQYAQESRGWSHTAVPGPGWVFFTPGAQSGPCPLVDIDRDLAEITRGSWCPSSPFAFRGPAKTCRSEHEPPGQHWNLNTHELPGYSQRPRSTGQMDTWEGRRESEGLTLQVRGAPDHRESWREPHKSGQLQPRGAAGDACLKRRTEELRRRGRGGKHTKHRCLDNKLQKLTFIYCTKVCLTFDTKEGFSTENPSLSEQYPCTLYHLCANPGRPEQWPRGCQRNPATACG